MSTFRDRRQAGQVLARALSTYADRPEVVVLGLPNGAMVVAHEIARLLHAPLDILMVRMLEAPGHDEHSMGAVASGGVRVLEPQVVVSLGIPKAAIETSILREQQELIRRERLYRGDRSPVDVCGRTVILVDDGFATASAMRAAVKGLRRRHPERAVVAIPVAQSSTCDALASLVDEIVCASTPESFLSIGLRYSEYTPTSDDDVRGLLNDAQREVAA